MVKQPTLEKKERFVNKLKQIYGDTSHLILSALDKPRYQTFRIRQPSVLDALAKQGFVVGQTAFPDYFYVQSSPTSLSETAEFRNHAVYIQGLSSAFAVFALNPQPGEKILDLCAAPGSKTIQIADKKISAENIYAIEGNTSRFFALKKNLASCGYSAVNTFKYNSAILPKIRPDFLCSFDKVLVDVPCSNEGLIRELDSHDFSRWNQKHAKKLARLQKKLLCAAFNLLKPGGVFVYSTCTYSLEENEEVISWFLKKFPSAQLQASQKLADNFVDGFIPGTVRILPNAFYDGFFVAKIKKL